MSNTYKGKKGEQGAELDLALISFQNWLSQFPIDKISANEKTFAESLLNEMKKEVVQTNYSFNDPRLVMIAFNLLKRNVISESEYDFTITEYMIVKQFWENTLDKNEIEPLNNFLDAYLDISLSEGDITDNEKTILKENAESIDITLVKKYCPLFLAEKLDDAIKYEIQEIDTSDIQEFDDEDVIISEIEELEEEEEVDEVLSEKVVETDMAQKIAEWQLSIETLQELIDGNDNPEKNQEWQEVIETLQELIDESSNKFALGGTTDKNLFKFRIPIWAVSPLINADISGLNDEEIEKLDEFVDDTINKYGNAYFMLGDLSDEVEFMRSNDIDGNLGGDVTTLYLRSEKFYGEGGEVDEIKSEIERQERKLGLASLPESAKDVIRTKIANLKKQLSSAEEKPKVESVREENKMTADEIRAEIERQERKLGLASLPESAKEVIRTKIEQLKGQLSKEEKPKPAPKVEDKPKEKPIAKETSSDSDILAEIERQERKLGLASLPESAKEVIRTKIANLKKQLSSAEEKPKEKPKVAEKPLPKSKPTPKVEEIEEDIDFEEESASPIEQFKGKKAEPEEEEIKVPKKRGRKPKPKPEIVEPKVPKKRGRKPKPKPEIVEPKVPQKRGRKPKPKLSLSDFGLGSKFDINDYI